MILRNVTKVESTAVGGRAYTLDCGHRESRPASEDKPRRRLLCSRCTADIAAKGAFGPGALR